MLAMSTPLRLQPRYSARSQLQEQQALQAMMAYAAARGYQVYAPLAPADGPAARTPWDKVRVLHQAMVMHPEVEFIFVLDSDVLPFAVDQPLVDSAGRVLAQPWSADPAHASNPSPELIVTGSPASIYDAPQPHPNREVNTGVIGVRNTPWAREFVRNMTLIGADWSRGSSKYDCDDNGNVLPKARAGDHKHTCHSGCIGGWCTVMKAFFGPTFMHSVYDQHAVVYLLRHLPVEDRKRVLLANWAFNFPVQISKNPDSWNPPGIVFRHWTGCVMGRDLMPTAGFKNETAREECFASWSAGFKNVSSALLALEAQRLSSSLVSGRTAAA
jgi:hypothetical protein